MTNEEILNLSKDSFFQKTLRTSLIIGANIVIQEDRPTYNAIRLSKRHALADGIYQNQDHKVKIFALPVAVDNNVNSAITIEGNNFVFPENIDALINIAAKDQFDKIAGVTLEEMTLI